MELLYTWGTWGGVIVVGFPVRYAHTHYGYSSIHDYNNGIKLVVEILRRMDKEIIESFRS